MIQEQEERLIKAVENINQKGYSFNGVHLLSGIETIKGDFYGFSIGATKPNTIKIIPKDNVILNGALLTVSDDIKDFASEGEFVPIEFTEIRITGTGSVKVWNK